MTEGAYPEGVSPFRRRAQEPLVARAVPVSADLKQYRTKTLQRDLLAGVTVAALAIPASMAFAEVAGVPTVIGLYALLVPCLVYACTGSSKRLMIGPEGATATMTGAALGPIIASDPGRAAGAAASLALLIGLVYLAARLIRLGWIADYFSRPVLVGYIHGVAFVLMIGQLAKMTGSSISANTPVGELAEFIREIGDISVATTVVGLAVVAVLFVLRRFAPKLPAALIVVVAAIIVSYAFDLVSHGVATIGAVPRGLPGIKWPGVHADELPHLLPAALGIFAVSFADSILNARSYAGRHMEHVHANQELQALGLTSVASALTQGMPVSASGSRTAVAESMGVRTQVAAFFSVAMVALVLVFLTAPLSYLPKSVLGGVILFAGYTLLDPKGWRALWRSSRREATIAGVTTLGVVLLGLLPALLIAVALSIVEVVTRSARPHDAVLGYVPRIERWADVETHPSAHVEAGVVVYRLDDRLFFANASYMKGRVREAIAGAPSDVHWLVFDAEAVSTIDNTGEEALAELVRELKVSGIAFAIARAHSAVEPTFAWLGPVYPTVGAAVAACRGKT